MKITPVLLLSYVTLCVASQVRFVHTEVGASNVDVYIGGLLEQKFENIAYKETTDYTKVDAGSYAVVIKPTGTDTTMTQTSMLLEDTPVTIFLFGAEGLGLSTISWSDNFTQPSDGKALLKFVHSGVFFPNLDVYLHDELTFSNIGYASPSQYEEVDAGTYDVSVTAFNDANNIINTFENLKLEDGVVYTVYLVGVAEGTDQYTPDAIVSVDADYSSATALQMSAVMIAFAFIASFF